MELYERFECPQKGGSGLRATQLIRPGTIVVTELPYAHQLLEEFWNKVCDCCGKRGGSTDDDGVVVNLKRCSRCRSRYYCGKVCQRQAWAVHKRECLKNTHVHRHYMPLLDRVLIKLALGNDGGGDGGRSVFDLKSAGVASTALEELLIVSQPEENLFSINGRNVEQELDLFGKLRTNVFTIDRTDNSEIIGSGLYLTSSLLNHDCNSNCQYRFNGLSMEVYANREIVSGEELTIAYTSCMELSSVRKKKLRDGWNFECACHECTHPTERDSLMLKKRDGTSQMSDVEVSVARGFTRYLESLFIQKNQYVLVLHLVHEFLDHSDLGEYNIFYYLILQTLLLTCGKLLLVDEYLTTIKKLVKILQQYTNGYQPMLSQLYYKVAFFPPRVSRRSLEIAVKHMRVTNGLHCPRYRQCKTLLRLMTPYDI